MNVVSFSGGKDSTAMLLHLLEKNVRLDKILYFDAGTWEFPQMKAHIDKVEKTLNVKIDRISPEKSFDYWFSQHILTKGKRKGSMGYGFPSNNYRWCTDIKIGALNKQIKRDDTLFIGLAYDEMHRVGRKTKSKSKNIVYPLVDAEITEAKALKMCYAAGFDWDGLYNVFGRVSCWCCAIKNEDELRSIYFNYPELWKRLENMQRCSRNTLKKKGKTVFYYTDKFKNETNQKRLF